MKKRLEIYEIITSRGCDVAGQATSMSRGSRACRCCARHRRRRNERKPPPFSGTPKKLTKYYQLKAKTRWNDRARNELLDYMKNSLLYYSSQSGTTGDQMAFEMSLKKGDSYEQPSSDYRRGKFVNARVYAIKWLGTRVSFCDRLGVSKN